MESRLRQVEEAGLYSAMVNAQTGFPVTFSTLRAVVLVETFPLLVGVVVVVDVILNVVNAGVAWQRFRDEQDVDDFFTVSVPEIFDENNRFFDVRFGQNVDVEFDFEQICRTVLQSTRRSVALFVRRRTKRLALADDVLPPNDPVEVDRLVIRTDGHLHPDLGVPVVAVVPL